MFTRCPKCDHQLLPQDQALPAPCPRCGVILAKVAQSPSNRLKSGAIAAHLHYIAKAGVREFAKAELANHRYVMVLHTHRANPHVHISARGRA